MKTSQVITILFGLLLFPYVASHSFAANNTHAPAILAHGAVDGCCWKKNSRQAVKESLKTINNSHPKNRFHGIEVDIVLTKDLIPILAHDPILNDKYCKHVGGGSINNVLIKNLNFETIKKEILCGGTQGSNDQNITHFFEPILGFDEFLNYVKNSPTAIIYLDLKIETGITMNESQYAESIFSRLNKMQLPNSFYIEGPTASSIASFYAHAEYPFTSTLSYPAFYMKENNALKGIVTKVKTMISPSRAARLMTEAGANATTAPMVIMSDKVKEYVQEKGLAIVFSVNTKTELNNACNSGVDLIIAGSTEFGPC